MYGDAVPSGASPRPASARRIAAGAPGLCHRRVPKHEGAAVIGAILLSREVTGGLGETLVDWLITHIPYFP